MIPLYIIIFIASCMLLFWSGKMLVSSLARMARYLKWREFVVAFFVVAFAGSIPNLSVGLSSAFHGIPELSFGDIVGGNLVNLTLAVALAALAAKGLSSHGKTIQTTSIFTAVIAVLPLLLILDGVLGRGDGLILLLTFGVYVFWLFSKEERFKKAYDENDEKEERGKEGFLIFLKDIARSAAGLFLLIISAEGIVRAASFFAVSLSMPLPLIGILVVGLGNALPEIHFAVASARKGHTGMILGTLMGCVIVSTTLVLGIVALICPIEISDFSPFAIGRIFLIFSSIFFFFFIKTDKRISKKEAFILLAVYFSFIAVEIFAR
jgi:cation:H+ antiporter